MFESRAAVLNWSGVKIESVVVPRPWAGQVLVKVLYSGLCGTQLLEFNQRLQDVHIPHMWGHEGVGEVISIGPGVTLFSPGDIAVLSWIKGSGSNAPGPRYLTTGGLSVNSGSVATLSQYATVAENRCYKKPHWIKTEHAALLGCCLPTGFGAVLKELDVRPLSSLAVVGAGGVGMCAIIAGLSQNAIVTAVDINPHKLAFAAGLGAVATQQPNKSFYENVFEASGSVGGMETAFEITRPGGTCVLAGNIRKGQKIQIDPFDLILKKNIRGTVGGAMNPLNVPKIDFDLGKMINYGSLEDVPWMIEEMGKGNFVGRFVVKMDH